MGQQWTFRVMNLRHHHHCDNKKTPCPTTRGFASAGHRSEGSEPISIIIKTGIGTVTNNGHLLANSLFGLQRMDIDNASVCIILNVLFYRLTSLCQEQQQWMSELYMHFRSGQGHHVSHQGHHVSYRGPILIHISFVCVLDQ